MAPPARSHALRSSALLLLLFAGGCRDLEVVTENYATLQEAKEAGALERGWLPRGLPPGSRELREAHDVDSNRRWGLFNFPPAEAEVFRSALGAELSLDGRSCNPPRRIEWWPLLLREHLDHEKIAATGHRAYASPEGGLIFVVNWNQGRAYYWTDE